MNSKKIVTIALVILLSTSMLEAKSKKKDEARDGGCITASAVKYLTEGGVLLACGVFGPWGVGACTVGLIATDNALNKKLEKELCD